MKLLYEIKEAFFRLSLYYAKSILWIFLSILLLVLIYFSFILGYTFLLSIIDDPMSLKLIESSVTKEIKFERGITQHEFKIKKSCVYKISIEFEGSSCGKITTPFFDDWLVGERGAHLPAELDILIRNNKHGLPIFSKHLSYGESGHIVGSNLRTFYVGRYYFEPGIYFSEIDIKRVYKKFSPFTAKLSLTPNNFKHGGCPTITGTVSKSVEDYYFSAADDGSILALFRDMVTITYVTVALTYHTAIGMIEESPEAVMRYKNKKKCMA